MEKKLTAKTTQGFLIYLLEDDAFSATVIRKALNTDVFQSHTLVVFDSLEALLTGLVNFTPEIVLVDLNVPDSRGLDTIIKISSLIDAIPIVVVSGAEADSTGEEFINYGAQDFIPKSELTASLLLRVIRFSILRVKTSKSLQRSAKHDFLTKLYNREALIEKLDVMINCGVRYNTKFSVCYLKINNIPQINEKYGHQAGDDILSLIANRLRLFSRASDFIARYDGNEFVTMFPNSKTIQDAISAARSQLKTIDDNYMITDQNGETVNVVVDCSVGLAINSNNCDTSVEIIEKAFLSCQGAQLQNRAIGVIEE
ncbi:diguanylate cyclase [Psychrosphaera sp. 1_MG-2023]|uniref:diguanylate cyclase n=1 Tax=Psychrosphaera sp. 1_MG-2023 TaxID=3062643 RepID=UPI0026E3E38C|nr:diguanylate cyclase [Psychrosphaera sp. 1_MG-2023]MDO6719760.1 diguanylate cyclase [Psychrosphaera sp. 1_MG-2023]